MVKIEIYCDAEEADARLPKLKPESRIFTREFETLTETLEYVIGADGARKEIPKANLQCSWAVRWYEILPGRNFRQFENVRHFHFNGSPGADEIFHLDQGPFLLDRETVMHDKGQVELIHPEWWPEKNIVPKK